MEYEDEYSQDSIGFVSWSSFLGFKDFSLE